MTHPELRITFRRTLGKGGEECKALFERLRPLIDEFASGRRAHTLKADRRDLKPLLIRALHALDAADNPR